jgi:hypothetical protein
MIATRAIATERNASRARAKSSGSKEEKTGVSRREAGYGPGRPAAKPPPTWLDGQQRASELIPFGRPYEPSACLALFPVWSAMARQGLSSDHDTRIGVAFPLERGGFNILFDALPTNGRGLLLPERERTVADEG